MSRLSLLIDVTKCTGCYNCFLACRDEHYGNDYPGYTAAQPLNDHFWMQIKEIERGSYPKPKVDYIPTPCQHCETAPCMGASENGAVYRRADGVVLIDPQKAQGQQGIVSACPYRVIFWNQEKHVAQKCTMCAQRLDQGEKQPRCVESCPTGALVFGDLDDPASDIAKLSAALQTESFHPEFKTAPSVRYIGLPKRFIAGEVVLKGKEGECAPGVKITLAGGAKQLQVTSNEYGDFEFDGLDKNTAYRIRFEKAGYAVKELEAVTLTDVNLGEVELAPV